MAQPGLAVGLAVGSAEAAAMLQGQVAEPAPVLAVTQTAGCRHASVRPRHLSCCCKGLNRATMMLCTELQAMCSCPPEQWH